MKREDQFAVRLWGGVKVGISNVVSESVFRASPLAILKLFVPGGKEYLAIAEPCFCPSGCPRRPQLAPRNRTPLKACISRTRSS